MAPNPAACCGCRIRRCLNEVLTDSIRKGSGAQAHRAWQFSLMRLNKISQDLSDRGIKLATAAGVVEAHTRSR
jgi:deoxyribodipyrimidine photolyase